MSHQFPLALQQAAVFKAMRGSLETKSNTAKKQMRVFWYSILIFFLWQFMPAVSLVLLYLNIH